MKGKNKMIHAFILSLLSLTLNAADIRVGYNIESMKNLNKKDLKISLLLWVDEIVSKTPYTVSYKDYVNSFNMADAFHKGELDLVIDFGINYIKNYDLENLVDGFRGATRDKIEENIVIILKQNSSLEDFAKLKKPVIAFHMEEEIFKIYGELVLIPYGKKYTLLKSKKRTAPLLKLFFNKADAAIVSERTFNFAKEMNPQIGRKLKIVTHSNIQAGTYGFFHKGFDEKKREIIRNIAINLDKTARGRQLLSLFKIDIVKYAKVSELNNIKKLYKEYKKLNRGRK